MSTNALIICGRRGRRRDLPSAKSQVGHLQAGLPTLEAMLPFGVLSSRRSRSAITSRTSAPSVGLSCSLRETLELWHPKLGPFPPSYPSRRPEKSVSRFR